MSDRKIITIITDALGDRVIIGSQEFEHAIEGHFQVFPQEIILALLEKILKDPTEIYRDDRKKEKIYNFFYKFEKGPKFIVVVIKVTPDGAFFTSMYPTGSKGPRNSHKKHKRIKL